MAPLADPDHRKLDTKLNAILAVTGVILLLLVLALLGVIDLVT